MSEETIFKRLKPEMNGLKDPGNVLIVAYILLVFFLLLFAGMESARADLEKVSEGTFSVEQRAEQSLPSWNASPYSDRVNFNSPQPLK